MNCTRPGCKTICLNVTGLKRHLTRSHGGWTTEEIAAAIADQESAPVMQPTQEERETLFAADSIPAHETPQAKSAVNANEPARERSQRSRKASIRMSQAMSGFKEKIAEMLPLISTAFFASKVGVVGNLNEDAQKTLAEMWSAYLDLLGFDVEAEPLKFKIGGKWLFLTFPVMMLGVTFFMMTDKKNIELKKKSRPVKVEPIFKPEPAPSSAAEEEEIVTEHEPDASPS
jgi:hypothetical protein